MTVQHHGQTANHDVADTGVIQRLEQWLEERHKRILAYSQGPRESASTGSPGSPPRRLRRSAGAGGPGRGDGGCSCPPKLGVGFRREVGPDSWLTADKSPRRRARRATWPTRSGLEARGADRWTPMGVDLVRGRGPESRVGPVAVVPGKVERQFLLHGGQTIGDGGQTARALGLERPDGALDHGEAAILADGPEPLPDAAATAPSSEPFGDELPALVRDEMPGLVAGNPGKASQERPHGICGGLATEDRGAHDAPRAVVDGDAHPPAEGPDLRQGEGKPRGPEAKRGGNARQIDMPQVVRLPGGDDARRWLQGPAGFRGSRRAQHPADGRRAEVQTRTCENPGDPDSPHGGAEDLQPPPEVADEVGEPVHRLGETDESVGPLFIEAAHPRGNGRRGDQKAHGGLGQRPATRRAKLEDGQPLGGRVMGTR